jgi:hypothetical protein
MADIICDERFHKSTCCGDGRGWGIDHE